MDEIVDLIDNYMEDKNNISLLEKLGEDINSMQKMINNLYYKNGSLKTNYNPDKDIHIISLTFDTLKKSILF